MRRISTLRAKAKVNEMDAMDISEELQRLVPIIGKAKARKLETAYLLGDESYRQRILEVLSGLKATVFSDVELKDSVLIEPPPRAVASAGDFQFGTVLYGKKRLYPLMLNKRDLLTHIGIFGSSGSGKTNIVHYLIRVLSAEDVPILIFDFSKRNYRDLLVVPELKERIRLYTVGRDVAPFRFNPLKPPEDVPIAQWAKEFAEVFDHAYWLLGGGRHVVLRALDELYRKYSPGFPRVADLSRWLDRYTRAELSSRERNWVATAKRPLLSLCLRETGEIFDCEQGLQPEQFFIPGRITILELDALSNDDKTFFIEIILQWLRDWLLVSNCREKLRGVIVLEEAHHVLNREKTKKFGVETVTDLIFREIRELGMGMVYVDQHPSLVSYPALGNTSTHVYMNLGLDTKYSSDIKDASSMLGLADTDESYLRRLPTGHAFILIRKSVFPNPFLVSFPLVLDTKGSVTDEAVREHMYGQLKEWKKQARDARMLSADRVHKRDGSSNSSKIKLVQRAKIESRMKRVNSKGWSIVSLLADAQASYTSELYRALHMSYRVFSNEVQKLIELGFVGKREGKVYKQTAVYFFLTHDGELAFALKSGRLPEAGSARNGAELEKLKRVCVDCLTLKGWEIVEDRIESGHLVFRIDDKHALVSLEPVADRSKAYSDIDNYSLGSELYFVCGTEQAKRMVAQQAAKYSFEHRGLNLIVRLATAEELKMGKGFKKIEFMAGD